MLIKVGGVFLLVFGDFVYFKVCFVRSGGGSEVFD